MWAIIPALPWKRRKASSRCLRAECALYRPAGDVFPDRLYAGGDVARHVLAQERPDVVIDVLNAGALERNLYLTIQLLELGVPVVLA